MFLSRRYRQQERIHAMAQQWACPSVCPYVTLLVEKMQKRDFFSKTKLLRAMVSIDDL